jgi:AcrR family transcriptional regulator
MSQKKSTKTRLIEALESSKTKTVSDICRIAGVDRSTYYYQFRKDADFRRQIFEKQREHLTEKIAAAA